MSVQISEESPQTAYWDYIIVGSGAGGGPLAANLAKAGYMVLLLEAGRDEDSFNYSVPAFNGVATEDPRYAWNYYVNHYQDSEQQQKDAKYDSKNGGILYPRASTLGGCTAHNCLITVYPSNSDWNQISEITGDHTWDAQNMRKYYERLEDCGYIPRDLLVQSRHGQGGWLSTSLASAWHDPVDNQLLTTLQSVAQVASQEFGMTQLPHSDPNSWQVQEERKQGWHSEPLCTRKGARNGPREYIRRVQAEHPGNLEIRTDALAYQVLFEGNKAVGVAYQHGTQLYGVSPRAQNLNEPAEAPTQKVYARREVILSCGAFNTPQLLMLSGVGPKDQLEKFDIPLLVDLPGVGQNLQDRYEISVGFTMKDDWKAALDSMYGEPGDPNLLKWQKTYDGVHTGPYVSDGVAFAFLLKSSTASQAQAPAHAPEFKEHPNPDVYLFGLPGKFQGYFPRWFTTNAHVKNNFTWSILKAHTVNTAGTVTLASKNPRVPLTINFNYFSEGNNKTNSVDLPAMVYAIQFARATMSKNPYVVDEEWPGTQYKPAADLPAGSTTTLESYIQNQAWGHHCSCTCKIGADADPMAVLDSQFRVRGVQNLRVVDASVFPHIPGYFIALPIYMISEKAFDDIVATARESDKRALAQNAPFKGVVQSGGAAQPGVHVQGGAIRPLKGAKITLFEATADEPVEIAHGISDAAGRFGFAPSKTTSDTLFYITAERFEAIADAADEVVLMALLGPELPPSIVINELTTVAAVYAAAQFLNGTAISGSSTALSAVAAMHGNLVSVYTGQPSSVLTASPNGDETNALRSLRSLANLLATTVRRPHILKALFDLTTLPKGQRPINTVSAIHSIARHPAHNAAELFSQSTALEVYGPALRQPPNAWTLAVKVNDSGDDANLFGGPGNLVFDDRGRAWITNNVVQGQPGSSAYCMVLDAAGRPAKDENGKRISPFTGGGLLGAGFGIDVDQQGRVWIGDFGWGAVFPNSGGVSIFTPDAQPVSEQRLQGGVFRAQSTVIDSAGNVWIASYGSNQVVVYPQGNADKAVAWPPAGNTDASFTPFGIAIDSMGAAWVTNSHPDSSSVSRILFDGTNLTRQFEQKCGRALKGIAIDKAGYVWVGSGGDNRVYLLDPAGTLLGGFEGGGMNGPWGVALDGDGNLWAGNFGPLQVGSVFTGRLTCLAAVGSKNLPQGAPLTPPTGYTLPSAGAQVLLHDGNPLYGPGAPPCYTPMMRATGLAIDQAGNVWVANNWKPDFDIDLLGAPLPDQKQPAGNPGGDGMVIFVGLAKPPVPKATSPLSHPR